MYNDRYNRGSYGPYGEPPGGGSYQPYQPRGIRMSGGLNATPAQDPYGTGARRTTNTMPGYTQPVTDAPPPWANNGFDRVTPLPGGEGNMRELGVRPYWANSTYLQGGMGGFRPGMNPYQGGYPGGYNQGQGQPAVNPQNQDFWDNYYRSHNSGGYINSGMPGSGGGATRGGSGGITGGFMGGRY